MTTTTPTRRPLTSAPLVRVGDIGRDQRPPEPQLPFEPSYGHSTRYGSLRGASNERPVSRSDAWLLAVLALGAVSWGVIIWALVLLAGRLAG